MDGETSTEKELEKVVDRARALFHKLDYPAVREVNKQSFGKCGTCKNLQFAESEFNILFARCHLFEVMIHRREAIVNCSSYEETGTMTLYDMKQIATLIDLDRKTMGFIIPPDRR